MKRSVWQRRAIMRTKKAVLEIGATGFTVKSGIIGIVSSIHNIQTEIMSLVRGTVFSTLQTADSVASETMYVIRDVIKGTIAATEELGIGLATTSKIVAKGIIMGVSD